MVKKGNEQKERLMGEGKQGKAEEEWDVKEVNGGRAISSFLNTPT